jgi:hypothetical protein
VTAIDWLSAVPLIVSANRRLNAIARNTCDRMPRNEFVADIFSSMVVLLGALMR